MKALLIATLICGALALGACRREEPYQPLKLGVGAPPAAQPFR